VCAPTALIADGLIAMVPRIGGEVAWISSEPPTARSPRAELIIAEFSKPMLAGEIVLKSPPMVVLVVEEISARDAHTIAGKLHAKSFVNFKSTTDDFRHAMAVAISDAEYFVGPKVGFNAQQLQMMEQDGKVRLSDRQVEILTMLVQKKPAREMAAQLGIAVDTVGAHILKLVKRFDLKSREQLRRYAVKNSIVKI